MFCLLKDGYQKNVSGQKEQRVKEIKQKVQKKKRS
jgi:hypothetical protein